MSPLKICSKFNLGLYTKVIIANILSFSTGCFFGWTSPAIPKLQSPTENPLDHVITSAEVSWIASLLPLGAATSTFITGYLSDRIGKKPTLTLSSISMLISQLIAVFSTNIISFYVSRFLCGLGVGGVFTVIPIYVGEIAERKNRGILGCFFPLILTIGIFFVYAVGPYVTLKTLSYINLGVLVTYLLLFITFVPESPYYTIRKDNYRKSLKALKALRNGTEESISEELMEIAKDVETSFETRASVRDLIGETALFRAITITCSMVIFQQLSGVNMILFYMQTIFSETGSKLSPEMSTNVISLVQVGSCCMTSMFVDRIGRKMLMFISCVGSSVALIIFGCYFYVKQTGTDMHAVFWLPIVCVVVFFVSYSLGLGPIPFVVLGEVFPPNVKSAASTVTIFICFLLTFCTTTFFPILVDSIGMEYIFWLLAVFCCVGAMFVYFYLPETKGKSLHEIQELLRK